MNKIIPIKMPKLSPTMKTGQFSSWEVQVGQKIRTGEVIAEIETDKAIMEVESLETGTIGYLFDIEKKDIEINKVIGYILLEDAKAPDSWEEYINQDDPKQKEILKSKEIKEEVRIKASPLAKKIASQENIDLSKVKGTGPMGRIVKADLSINSEYFKQTNIEKITGERLKQSKQEIPHFYLQKKICLQNLELIKANLAKFEKKISFTPFFIKATALALQKHPKLNCSYENEKIISHEFININIAIATQKGLYVPVIFDAINKSIPEIASELKTLSEQAKNGTLKTNDMQGGTFTISNLGMFGVTEFQAIINPPQVAILAISGKQIQAIWENNQFTPKSMANFDISCNHIVLDGIDAAKFMQTLAEYIENPEVMLL